MIKAFLYLCVFVVALICGTKSLAGLSIELFDMLYDAEDNKKGEKDEQ